ncbi:hypothetical protein CBM2637_A60083 [Cupriavidus taiwanensis]|nr:hypothetical protein CBM2637_A60083 [Cupriavidus taiwanensis]SPA47843.1 protein of unknown function [Cupriavidus taiwanensis]
MLNSDLKKLQLSLMCGAHTLPLRQFPPPAERSPYLSGHLKARHRRAFFLPARRAGAALFISRRPSPYGYPLCQALHILIKGVPAPGWTFLYNRGERLRRSIGWIWSRISSPR